MLNPSTLIFLSDLNVNNNKSWFDNNKKKYEAFKADYLQFTTEFLEKIKKIDPVLDSLTPKDCMFRINRDIRFSADKSPYKTNLAWAFSPGGKKVQLASYYMHIDPTHGSFIGGGVWMPESNSLKKVRNEINYFYEDLFAIVNEPEFKKIFKGLDVDSNSKLSRPPKGFEESNPAIEYLKFKSFTTSYPIEANSILNQKFMEQTLHSFTVLKPLINFLNRGLLSDSEGGI